MGRIVTAKRTQSDAGYFRIGNLILDIPPEQIQCHKVINSQEVLPLRFPFAIPVKTGQSRWDVTWSWKALTDPSADDQYAAWKDVQLLLAMFKAAPFVEVENEHIRQIVNPSQLNNGATADDAMAFALRQLRVDTVPDLADALQITMTMSLFNYRPYSANFQYDNGANKPASSALNSKPFGNYLQKWIQDNLMHDPNDLEQMGSQCLLWIGLIKHQVLLQCHGENTKLYLCLIQFLLRPALRIQHLQILVVLHLLFRVDLLTMCC